MRISRLVHNEQFSQFAGISPGGMRLSTGVDSLRRAGAVCLLSTGFSPAPACGQPGRESVRLYSPAAGTRWPSPSLVGRDETDLSAECAEAEAEAWLPRPHVHARRSADSQAAPFEGPQTPVGVMPPVQR